MVGRFHFTGEIIQNYITCMYNDHDLHRRSMACNRYVFWVNSRLNESVFIRKCHNEISDTKIKF